MMARYSSLNKINDLRRWVRSECERSRINVEFRDDIPGPCTNERVMYIPTFTNKLTEEDEKRLRFYVRHELSHHIEGHEYFDIAKDNGLDVTTPLGSIANIIEDQRIERFASNRYAGDALIISDGRELLGQDSLKFWKDTTKKHDELEDDSARMQSVFITATTAQAQWCSGAAYHLKDEVDVVTSKYDNVAEYLNTINKHGLIEKINTIRTPKDSFELAKHVYGLLWDKTPEEVEQEIQEKRAKQGEGEDGEEDKAGKGKKGKGKSGDKLGKGERDPKGSVDPRSGKFRIPVEFFVKSDHEERQPEEPSGHGLGLDYTNYSGHCIYEPEDLATMRRVDYHAGTGCTDRLGRMSSEPSKFDDLNTSSAFANRMRRYLQVKSAANYRGGYTKGLVHSRTLYRAALPIVGDGDYNKRVFKRKHEAELLNTSVSVLVDMSGSMCGDKVVHATRAAMLINHVISNVLRVSTEILTFSFDRATIMGMIKPFDSRVSDEEVYNRFDNFASRMWGNADADAILFTYDRLLRQTTKRKVLIVLSDGSPADGIGNTNAYHALKQTVKQIEDDKLVDIIGIGIMDDSVKEFYKQNVVINKASQLEDGLMQVITGNILKGVE